MLAFFIGGPKNGQVTEIRDGSMEWYVPRREEQYEKDQLASFRYRRFDFIIGAKKVHVFALAENYESIIEKLFVSYSNDFGDAFRALP